MKSKTHLRMLAIILSVLIISIPICFAQQHNLVYDANGNLVSGDGKYREYNSLNQLSKIYNGSDANGILLEEYTHHPVEERIAFKKVYNKNGSIKETVYYVSKNYVRVVNSSGTYDFTYIYHEGQLVAQLNPDGSKYFIHTDHLGSTSVITDESANVIENTTYSPFGEIVEGGESTRFDYTGKEYDSVVRDYDFDARHYDSSKALFNQPDYLLPNVYDPQQLNRYAYARNNPHKYKDERGHFPVLVLAAALIGGTYNTLQYYASHDNPTVGAAATYFVTGAAQGIVFSYGAAAAAATAIAGEGVERLVDDESLTENLEDYVAEGTLAFGAARLAEGILPKAVGSKNIRYLSSVFTKKSGQQFVSNLLTENVAVTLGQNMYYYNPNIMNSADDSNKADAVSGSSRSGSGGREYATSADNAEASSQIKKLQSSGFIKVSSGFARLASSRGISVSS